MVKTICNLALMALVSWSCTPPPPPVSAHTPTNQAPRTLVFADLAPTAEETAWRDAHRVPGRTLKAATIRVPGAFEQTPGGTRKGLDWDLLVEFGRVTDLPVEVAVPTNLKSFFSREGTIPADVETNDNEAYTPDLLKKVDLYIGPFAVLPWRERLMTLVSLYPMQNFLAGRKGEEVHSASQLSGKRVAVIQNAMQDNLLKAWETREGVKIRLVYVSPQDDLFDAVIAGRADYTLDGQLFFAQNRKKMRSLTLSPFESDPVRVGWAMKKADRALASLIRKYFTKVQENGEFERIFEVNYGTSFGDYMNVLATSIASGVRK